MSFADLPFELLSSVASHVYASGLPASPVSLDPLFPGEVTQRGASQPLLSTSWGEPVARRTLSSLCLVNHSCSEAAKPWLWRSVQVRLPPSWLALLDQLVEDVDSEDEALLTPVASSPVVDVAAWEGRSPGAEEFQEGWASPDVSVPPELLSPSLSSEPSPRRLRSKSRSPPRWEVIRSLSDAMENLMTQAEFAAYFPMPTDSQPGRFITRLDFNHFRTIGMRRSVDEGVKSRFVTGARLEAVLKEMPNLTAFGATEYMDGALTLPVLKELLLRGSPSGGRGRTARTALDYEEDRERWREYKEIEAIDLTGCVSSVFVHALTEFMATYVTPAMGDGGVDNRGNAVEPLMFAGLKRLGLRGVKSVTATVLNFFILACPCLTSLDVSCTRVTSDLLDKLSVSPSLRLRSLSLERCVALSGDSIANFLIFAPAAQTIQHLNLHGDLKFPFPLGEDHLDAVFTRAPCFTSGELVYLDISNAPLTPSLLKCKIPPQPRLRSLGLAYIATLPLGAIRDFIRDKASHIEVLSMANTSPELGYSPIVVNSVETRPTMSASTMAVHMQLINPLCAPPITFSWHSDSHVVKEPPTRLRVIELAPGLLAALHAGALAWKVVRSKGGRAWYVDTASGWETRPGGVSVLRRSLAEGHPLRREMEKLAQANGNVSSGVGWHARKMEILHGDGMLGREDGLYGAGAFAFQG